MRNLFNTETEDAMLKLINHQSQLIQTYREKAKTQDEIIHLLKRINEMNELQIKHLKEDVLRFGIKD
jgi:hypothetical protein